MRKNLGLMLQRHGDQHEARTELQAAIDASRGMMPGLLAQARYGLAAADFELGRRNAGLLHELRTLRTELHRAGDITCLSGCNRLLASLTDDGDPARLELLREVLPRLGVDDEHELGLTLLAVGELYRSSGRAADAHALAIAAGALQQGTGYGWNAEQRDRLERLVRDATRAPTGADCDQVTDRDVLVRAAVRIALR